MTEGRARILVLDDEKDMAENLSRILIGAGHQPIVCSDSLDAMALIRRERPDLVVTDLRMPGLSGMDLLARMREDQISVPVIMITGYATIDAAVEAMRKGASDFLAKPFSLKQLAGKVKELLE